MYIHFSNVLFFFLAVNTLLLNTVINMHSLLTTLNSLIYNHPSHTINAGLILNSGLQYAGFLCLTPIGPSECNSIWMQA